MKDVGEAKKLLIEFLGKTAFRLSLLYCIRPKEHKIPIGYINFNTPKAQTGIEDWSVDFWMGSSSRGNGLMTYALHKSLLFLRKYSVPRVKALVDKDNIKSIRVLENIGFAFQEEELSNKRFLYSVEL